MLIESIRTGKYSVKKSEIIDGSFGTWANGIHPNFTLKKDLLSTLQGKMVSPNDLSKDYFFNYFFKVLVDLEPTPSKLTTTFIKRGLEKGEECFHEALFSILEVKKFDPWVRTFREAYDSFIKKKPSAETPFPEEDIPF
jgi:hypothetical protein